MAKPAGRYELVRRIGRGGMAEVFLARRRGVAGIAKRLVVKRMRSDLGSDPRLAELFLREARVATQLSHKNIVTVFDVGRDADGLFLAMEHVDGPDLSAALAGARERGVTLDPLLAAHIAAEVAAGLDHAHRLRDERGAPLGLVHRDVTPRNILLSLSGEVKVTDFGVAVLHGDAVGERRGTVPYMSPEQARGQAVDARADLFSLGLVLHELLAGRRAYGGNGREEMLEQARAGALPPLGADVPAELARVVERATRVEPGARHADARELQRELAAWALRERGRSAQTEPLEHALASFLACAVPGWGEQSDDEIAGGAAGTIGTATLQSVAETVGEIAAGSDETGRSQAADGEGAAPAPTEPPPGEPPAEVATGSGLGRPAIPRRRRRAIALGTVAAAAIGAAAAAMILAWRGPAGPPPARSAVGSPSSEERVAIDRAASEPPAPRASEPAPPAAPEPGPTPTAPADPDRSAARAAGARRDHRRAPRRTSGGPVGRSPSMEPGPADPAPARGAPTGTLDFNAVPWAYVSIDGRAEEETPIRARVLAAGRHRLRVRNPVLERVREVSIEIQPGETTRYVVDLRQ